MIVGPQTVPGPNYYYGNYEKQFGICKYSRAYHGKSVRTLETRGKLKCKGCIACLLTLETRKQVDLRYWKANTKLHAMNYPSYLLLLSITPMAPVVTCPNYKPCHFLTRPIAIGQILKLEYLVTIMPTSRTSNK